MPDNTTLTAADAALDEASPTDARRCRDAAQPRSCRPEDRRAGSRSSSEANERALRAQAELENYRKRSQRELADERRYAVVPLVRDLLAVVDNLERAIEAAPARSASEVRPAACSKA